MDDPKRFLRQLFDAAVLRAQPSELLKAHLPMPPRGKTVVVGAGKAGGAMAQAFDAMWPQTLPLEGLVVTRYGHTPPAPKDCRGRIEIVEASHPVPDDAGRTAAARILNMVRGLTADDLVVFLASGGGSSLLTLPAPDLPFAEKQRINRELLLSGANISEMNCVRKHLSLIKGGRLAAAARPARVITLAISDVPGDDVSTIASGPTVPDDSTCEQALEILRRYGVTVPGTIEAALRDGSLETPKPDAACFEGNEVRLIATPQMSLEAAGQVARLAGFDVHILSDEMEGESREVGKVHAAIARAVARRAQPFRVPCVILSGGETTVSVKPLRPGWEPGRGGRAGEFCMGLASALQGWPDIWALAADTDGIDGVEDNAGAFVTPDTLTRGQSMGRKIEDYLDRNDAYGYFSALGDLLVTGPTYTNVNDFRVVLVV
ncbi:glycerate kinase (plasmid) [Cupriavidus pinatubonensis]|uniref:glycerate kinase type-2 family protein n=1 Tax=Cupriavidus pinatubonensis TaxID=248026 RepID=UPI001C739126|nr:glycerate kinase [Cupriavidus pinatubonensis]QYY33849.1 glycerate kinase [Cupriavidus pinatubonensis]